MGKCESCPAKCWITRGSENFACSACELEVGDQIWMGCVPHMVKDIALDGNGYVAHIDISPYLRIASCFAKGASNKGEAIVMASTHVLKNTS